MLDCIDFRTNIMDEIMKDTQEELSWCILFADDIVLTDEIRNRVSNKLEK